MAISLLIAIVCTCRPEACTTAEACTTGEPAADKPADYRIVFRYRGCGPASDNDYESAVTVHERQKDGSEKLVGTFTGSIFPDDMKTRGRLKDGRYDLYLGLHRRSKDGKYYGRKIAVLEVTQQR